MEIRYNPNHFQIVDLPAGSGLPARQILRQEVWEQQDDDTWLYCQIEQPASGFRPRPYIKEALIRRDPRPDGSWRTARSLGGQTLRLVEDPAAPPAPAPERPTGPRSAVAAAYIASRYGDQQIPQGMDIAAVRRKRGMY